MAAAEGMIAARPQMARSLARSTVSRKPGTRTRRSWRPRAHRGVAIGSPDKRLSMIVAWISTPGWAASSGVVRISLRPAAVVPTMAIFPFSAAGSAVSSRMAAAEMWGKMMTSPAVVHQKVAATVEGDRSPVPPQRLDALRPGLQNGVAAAGPQGNCKGEAWVEEPLVADH